ncbi:MAG: guanylate kinase [Chloroflexi bacterium RBG_13_51_52]|nr:MAG: guanylate kinase [Chloroflexi bacterium RBG_13_51_52]
MSRDTHSPLVPTPKPLLIVLSGLSGVGKDTVLAGLRKSGLPAKISVSATTRDRRAGEKEGVDYYFVSAAKFQEMIDSDRLLEWATVYGNRYGIPEEPVRKALKSGQDVIVKIDVQGAATIKKKMPGAILIFLVTISLEELEQRLKKRRTEKAKELELRLKTAIKELDSIPMFDYIVVNREGKIDRTIADIMAIITAEKCRAVPRDLNV